jgi:hypothetical protein
MRLKYLGLSLVLLFLLWQNEVSASGISVAPASINRCITEEDHIIPITIKNPGSETLEYRVYACSLGQGLDGDSISLDNTDLPYSLVKWVEFNLDKFKLEANGSQIVEANIQIPKDSCGGLYGIIYIEAEPAKAESSPGPSMRDIASIPRVGVITLLTLPGESIKEAEITAVELVQGKAGEEIHILSTFHNTGNIHLRPEGNVVIRNKAGERIASVFIKPGIILPDYARQLIARWKPENLRVGTYTAESNMTFGGKALIARRTFEVINTDEIAIVKGEVDFLQEIKTVQHKPICFNLLFYNGGNITLPIGGEIEIKGNNKIIKRVGITPDKVMPYSSKGLKSTLTNGLPMGSYTAIARVKYADKIATATTYFNVIEKEIIQAGEIIELTIPRLVAGKVLILPELLFKNTGNVSLKVEGMIELENSQGITVGQIIIDTKTIEPDKTERLGRSWQGELSPGLYKTVATLIFGDGKVATKESSFLVIK